MKNVNFEIPTPGGKILIEVSNHKALFILGRNGTGKSALVHYVHSQCRRLAVTGNVIYLPGSRPSYFDGNSLTMTANSRYEFERNSPSWDASPQIRVRPISGTARNERAIYDLQAEEVQYRVKAANEIEVEGAGSPAIARLQSKSSPLDRVNRLLQQANLPIQTVIDSGELKAVRDGNIYSISMMSDGERTALILIADVIAAKPASIFLVDEPELHLHRAIVVPLLSALLAERPDCTMIISTHELALANKHPESPIVLVRGCKWTGEAPSQWEVDLLPNSESIPDDLRIDILGSRQTILFIEGASSSRDQPLYATLFPKISLRHRSSCTDVRRAVVGLRQIEAFHHARAFGLVDNDGMDAAFQDKLLNEGIYALPVFAVESLYYSPEVIAAVATRQGETLKTDSNTLIVAAKDKALSTLRQNGKIEHLAARIAERQMRDKLLQAMPDRAEMVASGDAPMNISLQSPYPATLARIRALLHAGDLDAIVAGFPVRESGILGDIAQSLRFIGELDYEKAALAAISVDPTLAARIKAKLGDLAGQLQ
jgi:ABC-type cobalamin/Fe3+-siderophores transport system ATPase subunit